MRYANMMVGALATLAGGAIAQSVTLHFESDRPAVRTGETAHWVVRASFAGYPDPTAYFGGFVGDFPVIDPESGVAMNYVSHMVGNVTTPTFNGASIENLNFFNSALLGSDDPANPIDIGEFDVAVTATEGSLSYDALGVASVFYEDFIFLPPDQYLNDDTIRQFAVETDTLVIADEVEPMPEVGVVLRADRTDVMWGDAVTWTLGIEYTGWNDPGAYVVQVEGDLLANEPLIGLAADPVSLIGGDTSCVTDGASLLDLIAGQPLGGPYDTANPIALCEFEVQTTGLGQLHYDLAGRVVVQHPAYPSPHRVRTLSITSDTVNVRWPGCNPADLVEPWDVLDSADLIRFVELFLARDLLVDLAEPEDVLDLADIVAFVQTFTEGCP